MERRASADSRECRRNIVTATISNFSPSHRFMMPKFASQTRVAFSSILWNTGCSSPGEEADDLQHFRRRGLLLQRLVPCRLHSLNSRTFSMAMTAWSAKVCSSSMSLAANGPGLLRVTLMTPIDAAVALQRHEQPGCGSRAPAPSVSHPRDLVRDFGVGDLRSSRRGEPSQNRVRAIGRRKRRSQHCIGLLAHGRERRQLRPCRRRSEDPGRRVTADELVGALGDGLEHRLHIRSATRRSP